MVDRGFLFTIVNTVQPDHFPNEFIRLEREKAEADRKRQHDMVEVSPEILTLLEQFGQSNFLRNHGQKNARSLSKLKMGGPSKRRRADFD